MVSNIFTASLQDNLEAREKGKALLIIRKKTNLTWISTQIEPHRQCSKVYRDQAAQRFAKPLYKLYEGFLHISADFHEKGSIFDHFLVSSTSAFALGAVASGTMFSLLWLFWFCFIIFGRFIFPCSGPNPATVWGVE